MLSSNPYSNAIVIQFDNGDISLDRLSSAIIKSNSTVHTVLNGETIQSIAYKYYKDSGKWVDIADVNSIYNPFTELEEGLELYIP